MIRPPRSRAHRRGRRRALLPLVVLVTLLGLLAGCGGGSGSGGGGDTTASATKQLARAEKALAEAKGVTLSLKTDKLPKGKNGILSAQGIGTSAPAFKGSISAVLNGLSGDLPVVAVGGKVYVRLFNAPYSAVDPKQFSAPDPATFFGPDGSLAGLLGSVTSIKAGDDTRDGREVLSTITGKIPGSAVQKLFSAAGDGAFDATFTLDDSDRLVSADVTGAFYGGSTTSTYRLGLSKYGTTASITAP